jgi:hypothetical protein
MPHGPAPRAARPAGAGMIERPDALHPVPEAARLLRCSQTQVHALIRRSRLSALKHCRPYAITDAEIQRFIREEAERPLRGHNHGRRRRGLDRITRYRSPCQASRRRSSKRWCLAALWTARWSAIRPEKKPKPGMPAWSREGIWLLALRDSRVSGASKKVWSGRRDSNPRLQPWQGCALPLSYARTPQRDTPHGRLDKRPRGLWQGKKRRR